MSKALKQLLYNKYIRFFLKLTTGTKISNKVVNV